MADINARTRLLTGTTAQWAANNLVIGNGELVVERATGPTLKLKVGDGVTAYGALPFVSATPIIPLEYLTEAEGDARYLQLTGISAASTANLVPRMGADGKLAAAMIPLPPSVTSSVGAADAGKLVALDAAGKVSLTMLTPQVNASAGVADAGKVVLLAANGKVSPTMIEVTTGGYLGPADVTAAVPAGAYLAGDYFINTTAGTAHASWGLGAVPVTVGQQVIYDGSAWDLIGSGAAYLPLSGGTMTPESRLNMGGGPVGGARITQVNEPPISSAMTSTGHTAPNAITLRTAGGTVAVPAVTPIGNFASYIGGVTADGVDFFNTAALSFTTDGAQVAGSLPSAAVLYTTQSGATVRREVARFDSAGNFSLGGVSPVASARAWIQADASIGITGALQVATFGAGNIIQGRSYGGTPGAPAATGANLPVLALVGGGTHDGATFANTASVQMHVEGVPAAGSQPTYISFQTTPAGSTTRREVAQFNSAGSLGIGVVPAAAFKIDMGAAGGQIGGVLNIAGTSDSGAYTIFGGRTSLNGGYVQLYGGSHATLPNMLIFGNTAGPTAYLNAAGNLGLGGAPAVRIHSMGPGAQGRVRVSSTDASGVTAELQADSSNSGNIGTVTNHDFTLFTNSAARLRITAAGVIQDGAGLELGFKGLPAASLVTGGPFTAADRGKCVYATGPIECPNNVMGGGDCVTIINTTASAITIVQGAALTMRLAGTASIGNRTLAAYGIATVIYFNPTAAFISGTGLS